MTKIRELTQELVQSLFTYKGGELFWKVKKAQCIHIGDKAGTLNKGYYRVKINQKLYFNHRIIFLYHHDYIPKEIDHIDGDSTNNLIENLREVTHQQNLMSQKPQKNSSSKYKGVSWDKIKNKWIVYIKINDRNKFLGRFTNEIDAAKVYNIKATELFGEFAYLNEVE